MANGCHIGQLFPGSFIHQSYEFSKRINCFKGDNVIIFLVTLGLEAACAGGRMARSRSESREACFPWIPVKAALGSAQPVEAGLFLEQLLVQLLRLPGWAVRPCHLQCFMGLL